MSADIVEYVDQKFRSGNSVPIDRAWMSVDEWAQLHAEIVRLRGGWEEMTRTARQMQMSYVDNHQGDVYHAMQALVVKKGLDPSGPMFQPIASIAPAEAKGDGLACYDAGMLSDYGGGNVEWWWDYIRAELGRAHDFYASQVTPQPAGGEAVLAGEIAAAVAADEAGDGCDLSAGLFGPAMSALIRRITTPPAAQVQQDVPPTLPVVIFGETYEVPIRVQLHIEHLRMKLDAIGNTKGTHPVQRLLDATEHCLSAADEGVEYGVGRPMLDAMTTLGLMEKVGRGKWAPTDAAERFVTHARAAHPAGDALGADRDA